ncbi:cell division protein SepF [Streptomyces sp. NPDC048639]|uniref:cell division protein SepF n=1 Tax=Streptomyces sp. NPDC048639 TaxID=3365581 RepID=UPI00371EE9A3
MNRHDVTDEQWEGLADVVPLRGSDAWPSWPGEPTLPGRGQPQAETEQDRRFVVLRVQCFADAREVADCLMEQSPVLVDLTAAEPEVAKRVLDFASGVAFGLGARMHRVDTNVFLLTPSGMEVEEPRLGAAAAAD